MSLDVYLMVRDGTPKSRGAGIYIREGGSNREITREEWDERFPDREPIIAPRADENGETIVFEANITHNLNMMAARAGIYYACWRPEQIGATHARHIIYILRSGVKELEDDPDYFKQLNPENGWGDYGGLLSWVKRYLAACEEWPNAEIEVSR